MLAGGGGFGVPSGWATGRFRGKLAPEHRRKSVLAVQNPEQERIVAEEPVAHDPAPLDAVDLFISGEATHQFSVPRIRWSSWKS